MIKMMIIGRRRAAMTVKQLHSYMASVHGPMVVDCFRRYPDVAPHRYAQNHVFEGTHRTGNQGADVLALNRDFVTQVWFADMAAAAVALQQPFYFEKLQPDEDNFVDQATVMKIPVSERLVHGEKEAQGRFKVFLIFTKLEAVKQSIFQNQWNQFSSKLNESLPGLQRHVQCDPMQRPGAPSFVDGINECWFGTHEEAVCSLEHSLELAAKDNALSSVVAARSMVALAATEIVLYKKL